MQASSKISATPLNLKIASGLLDMLVLVVSTVLLYFVILYTIFNFGFGYQNKQNQISTIETEYNLNLPEGLDYTEYEKVLKAFYTKHADDIVKKAKELYGEDYSMIHIYNYSVLQLTVNPTYDNYKTTFYQYIQLADGSFDVDSYALRIQGEGYNYDRYMSELFHTAYNKLKTMLMEFDSNYNELKLDTNFYEVLSRLIAFIISVTILYVIIPLTNRNKATLFGKVFKLATVNKKTGYLVPWWKIILYTFLEFIIPTIGIIIGGRDGIVILFIGFELVNYLFLIFGKRNTLISESITRIITVNVEQSLLFTSQEDEQIFVNSPEGKELLDADYLSKLSNVSTIEVPTDPPTDVKQPK